MAGRKTYRNQKVGTLLTFRGNRAIRYRIWSLYPDLDITLVLYHLLAIALYYDTLAVVGVHNICSPTDIVLR
jgi:hypothetical protein